MITPIGTKNPLYSPQGIILLLGVQYGPLVFLMVRAGLRKLPRELVEAARSGGAGWFTVMRTIILPLMTPSIVAAAALLTNSYLWTQFPHTVLSGFTTGAFFVLGISAYHLLRKTDFDHYRRSFQIAAAIMTA